jgi:hypothetical protein
VLLAQHRCWVSQDLPKQDCRHSTVGRTFGAIRWQRHTISMTMRTSISVGPKRPKPNVNAQYFCRWPRLGWKSPKTGRLLLLLRRATGPIEHGGSSDGLTVVAGSRHGTQAASNGSTNCNRQGFPDYRRSKPWQRTDNPSLTGELAFAGAMLRRSRSPVCSAEHGPCQKIRANKSANACGTLMIVLNEPGVSQTRISNATFLKWRIVG